jgi:hypothetical protein
MARKKDTYEVKKGKSKWDISDWVLDNSFMTDKEIKEMINLLKGHMYMKYNTYNEEVIHMTILQGLRSSHLYNPQKASKLVWFQSILRNIFIHDVDPKYNIFIRYHYSFDWRSDDDTENSDIINEALSKSTDDEDDLKNEVINFTEDIIEMINEGDYVILKLRVLGDSYADMSKKLKMKTHQMSQIWKEERERLKQEILKRGLTLEVLEGRKGLNVWTKGYKTGKKKPRVFVSSTRTCKMCLKEFNFLPGMGPNTRTCSQECREKSTKELQSAYAKKLYYEKSKENKKN